MRVGAVMRRVADSMERLGHDLGRPPFIAEISADLEDVRASALSKSLSSLVDHGYVESPAPRNYVLVRTLDGRPVTYSMAIGPAE